MLWNVPRLQRMSRNRRGVSRKLASFRGGAKNDVVETLFASPSGSKLCPEF